MAKFKRLNGVANNLADSFAGPLNREYLYEMGAILRDLNETNTAEIDFLSGKVKPLELNTKNFKKSMSYYKKWFLDELKRIDININQIDKVIIKVTVNLGRFSKGINKREFMCSVAIKANNKEYKKSIFSAYIGL